MLSILVLAIISALVIVLLMQSNFVAGLLRPLLGPFLNELPVLNSAAHPKAASSVDAWASATVMNMYVYLFYLMAVYVGLAQGGTLGNAVLGTSAGIAAMTLL